jgi:hypothetical protein
VWDVVNVRAQLATALPVGTVTNWLLIQAVSYSLVLRLCAVLLIVNTARRMKCAETAKRITISCPQIIVVCWEAVYCVHMELLVHNLINAQSVHFIINLGCSSNTFVASANSTAPFTCLPYLSM